MSELDMGTATSAGASENSEMPASSTQGPITYSRRYRRGSLGTLPRYRETRVIAHRDPKHAPKHAAGAATA